MADRTGGQGLLHPIPGMHEYEGVMYLKSTPKSLLQMVPYLALTPDDILLATYPKSGTTWMQEILYLFHNGVDLEEAKSKSPMKRVPFVELEFLWPTVTAAKPPRLLKTHLRVDYYKDQIIHSQAKFIVVLRNPKDTLVSYYYFYKKMADLGNFDGTWNDFFELIKADQLIYGDWFDFTVGWWEQRNKPNVLVVKYEDMKRSPEQHVRKLASFCGKDLSDEQIQTVVNATSFDTMKKNPQFEVKMRKGATGDWKNHLTAEQNDYIEKMCRERLDGTGLEFDYEN